MTFYPGSDPFFNMNIFEIIAKIITMFANEVKSLVDIVIGLFDGRNSLFQYFTWVPGEIQLVMGLIISVAIVYKILGRS